MPSAARFRESRDPVLNTSEASQPIKTGGLRRWTWQHAAVVIACAFPPFLMLNAIRRAPRMHYLDYWDILGRAVSEDGGLRVGGLLTLQNGHPTWLPALWYYLSARYLSGTNTDLALTTWVLATVTLLLLLGALPMQALGGPHAAATAVLASWLVFSPKGLHNFAYGMSGVAWWSAAIACVGAILLAARGRWWLALPLGLVATACYGTSFAVWPALSVVALLSGCRVLRIATPLGIGAGLLAAWISARPAVPTAVVETSPSDRLQGLFSVIGGIWFSSDAEVAALAGTVVLVTGIALCVLWGTRALAGRAPASERFVDRGEVRLELVAPWAGLVAWGVGAAVLISASRSELGPGAGLASRYTSVPAVTVIAVSVLCMLTLRHVSARMWSILVCVAALVTTANATAIGHLVRGTYDDIWLSAIATRIGAPGAVPTAPVPERYVERLRALGGYPFGEGFTLGCGGHELGGQLRAESLPELPPVSALGVTRGTVDGLDRQKGLRAHGWAVVDNKAVDCVLVVAGGEVVGAGVVRQPRPDVAQLTSVSDTQTGWTVVAARTTEAADVVFVVDGWPVFRVNLHKIGGMTRP